MLNIRPILAYYHHDYYYFRHRMGQKNPQIYIFLYFRFFSLAGYIPICTKACMKSYKIAYVTLTNRLTCQGNIRRSPKAPSRLGRRGSPDVFGVSFSRLPRLKSNVPLPKQFSGSAPAWWRFTLSECFFLVNLFVYSYCKPINS